MSCKYAKTTDEYHGWECSVTGGACMFLFPNSKACAEKYGEGPDAETEPEEFVDNVTKYECLDCGKQFILGDAASEKLPHGFPVCPYCGKSSIEWRTKAESSDIEDMGCMEIWTSSKGKILHDAGGGEDGE
ncbi:MAG: hypothetical protein PHQ72_14735 [Hespellia sp.]|nr:hypothetical protein [Hespellia sp.]